MPTTKIGDAPEVWITSPTAICSDSDHFPPQMMVWEPGLYEHVCPSCKRVTRFTVATARVLL